MNLFWSFLLSSLIYLFQQPRISSDTKRGFYWSKFHVRETIYIRRTDLIYPPLSRTKPLKDVGAVDLRIGGSEICFNGILRSSLRIFIAPALFWDSWFLKKVGGWIQTFFHVMAVFSLYVVDLYLFEEKIVPCVLLTTTCYV